MLNLSPMQRKTDYEEIFIFVSGSTPQIITETICALAVKSPPVYPSKIIVITTSEGVKTAQETLINQSVLSKLFNEYNIPHTELIFETVKDASGKVLSDIRTAEDNKLVANRIARVIADNAKNPKARLHCSIAGGRKTMSFYLGSALQLYGRPQDKLYHVLVTPEFETNRDFFYKPKKNRQIKTKDGRILNTDDAKIELAELPFLRLGDKIKLSDEKDLYQAVGDAQTAIDEAVFSQEVSVNLKMRELRIGDIKIDLPPVQFALYATFLKLKKSCKKPKCNDCRTCFIQRKKWDESKKKVFREFYNKMRTLSDKDWFEKYDPTVFTTAVSKINRIIREKLGNDTLAQDYLIKSKRLYGETQYTVNINRQKIKIV